uniref:BTB domain-containing protein n=1 Tax=viral metagenome TaxID=1070528 RepID=A0A6C0E9A1_9ZZZZ
MSGTVKLNVGGVPYETTKNTLTRYQGSMLESMFSGRHTSKLDENGRYFIDRDGDLFKYVLKFLRDGNINLDDASNDTKKNLMDEAKFYCLDELINILEQYIGSNSRFNTGYNNDTHINNIREICFIKNFDINEFETMFNQKLTLKFLINNCEREELCYRLRDTYHMFTVNYGHWDVHEYNRTYFKNATHSEKELHYNFLCKVIEKLGDEIFESLFSKNIIKTQFKSVRRKKSGTFEFHI